MLNFQNSKIYKLVSNQSDDIYIGSSVHKLASRLYQHKSKSNKCVSKSMFVNDAIISIILIEAYPCNNKYELRAREHHYITTLQCINKYKPFDGDKQTYDKQYYKDNAAYILIHQKKYKKEHAADIAIQKKIYNKNYRESKKPAMSTEFYNLLKYCDIIMGYTSYKRFRPIDEDITNYI